ncbi:MAG TPA: division/cell wall cluster transcriptional repressor MraZ [Eubacterium sp.]|nr:division/cell wall cluster transcriptional repressor MraZ [Eubacterium sp.]
MFIGEHKQKMDTKGRVVVPSKFRDELGNQVVVTKGLGEQCLYAFSRESWEKVVNKLEELPMTNMKVRNFNRFFLAGANNLEADKLGRVLVSSALREYALLDKEVVWVGVGNRMEIWDVDKWKENSDKFTGDSEDGIDMEELSEYMAELGI